MKEDDHLHNDLLRLMIGDEHLLKIKAQYLDERTALNLRNPVNFAELEQYFQVLAHFLCYDFDFNPEQVQAPSQLLLHNAIA